MRNVNYVVDLDGTVADTQHIWEECGGYMDAFHERIDNAQIIPHAVHMLIKCIAHDIRRGDKPTITIITARSAEVETVSMDWFMRKVLSGIPIRIIARRDMTVSPVDFKERVILKEFDPTTVECIFEDDPEIIQMYIKHGYSVVQIPRMEVTIQ